MAHVALIVKVRGVHRDDNLFGKGLWDWLSIHIIVPSR